MDAVVGAGSSVTDGANAAGAPVSPPCTRVSICREQCADSGGDFGAQNGGDSTRLNSGACKGEFRPF